EIETLRREKAAAGDVAMTEPLEDALKTLQAALDIAPSPEFAAEVRARTAGSQTRMWWTYGPGALAAAAVAVTVLFAIGRMPMTWKETDSNVETGLAASP